MKEGLTEYKMTEGWVVTLNFSMFDAHNSQELLVPSAGALICRNDAPVASITALGDFTSFSTYDELQLFQILREIQKVELPTSDYSS